MDHSGLGERSARRRSSAEVLAHPLVLASIAILVVNDHMLKAAAPGFVTGKVSDVAGLVFFPVLVATLIGFVAPKVASARAILGWSIVGTAIGFIGTKASTHGNELANMALGMLQWVATAGPLRDDPMMPTTMVVDPTDLVALPALGVAWLIGTRRLTPARSRPWPSLPDDRRVVLAVLVIASTATLGTSPATKFSSVEHEEALTLDRESPAAVRYVSYRVANRDPTLYEVVLTASMDTQGAEPAEIVPAAGVTLTMEPDPAAPGIQQGLEGLFGGTSLSLTEACQATCEGGAWIFLHLDQDAPDDGVSGRFHVGLMARGGEGEGAVDVDLRLDPDPARGFDGVPASSVASVGGRIRVGVDEPHVVRQLEIVIAEDALQGPLRFPLVGRISGSARTTEASHHPYAHSTAISDGAEYLGVLHDERSLDLDLLGRCTSARECRLRLFVESDYDGEMNDEDPGSAEAGFVELQWSLEVRLDAFDGRQLRKDAVRIEVVDAGS